MRTRKQALKHLEKKFDIGEFVKPIDTHFKPWLDELNEELKGQEKEVKDIIEILLKSDRVYTVGLGRSRLGIMTTGMRFMHAGYQVEEVGHPYAPAMGTDEHYKDVLIIESGSGETNYAVTTAKIAKNNKVPIIAITSNPESRIAKISDKKIVTKGKRIYPTDSKIPSEEKEPINFMQTKSEDKASRIGELLINYTAKMRGLTENDMQKRHANTEYLKEPS